MTHTRNGRVARTRRQLAADERAAGARGRKPREQIASLDERLGRGVGATKERSKLAVAS